MLKNEHAGVGKIIHEKEFAARRARAPHRRSRGAILFRLMEAPDQRGDHMAVIGMVIVAGAVQVCRHGRYEIHSVLAAIGLTQLDPGNLGDGIPFVRRLERSGEQFVLAHRLARKFRIDAGGSEKQELLYTGLVAAVNGIERDREISCR